MRERSKASDQPISRLQDSGAILDALVDMCLALISGATRCRCVGIRVEEHGDFPLVRWLGFSEKFVERERSLLPAGAGSELNIEERLARLECLCGQVIRGERTGCEGLFTTGGCLWFNDFSLTDEISPYVRRGMRTACFDKGFQSLALVPCSPDDRTLALLHVSDRRRGLLSKRLVSRLEETAEHFAKLLFQLRELKRAMQQIRKAPAKPLRVLVVDDEIEMADLVAKILQTKGHRPTTASGGAEALEILAEEKVDLVITDFNMPVMSGPQLAKEIGKRWKPYAPPVILMSGTYSEEAFVGEKRLHDVAGFIGKPFSTKALMDAIHAALH